MKSIHINIPTGKRIVKFLMNYTSLFVVLLLVTLLIFWELNTQNICRLTCNSSYTMMDSVRLNYRFDIDDGIGRTFYLSDGKSYEYKHSDWITIYMTGIPIHTIDNIHKIERYKTKMYIPASTFFDDSIKDDSIEVDALINGSHRIFMSGDWFLTPFPFSVDTMFSSFSIGIHSNNLNIKHLKELDYNECKFVRTDRYEVLEKKYKRDIYIGPRGEYYIDGSTIDGKSLSSTMQIKPQSHEEVTFKTEYCGKIFDSTNGLIHTIIDFNIENLEHINEVTITFESGFMEPYRIVSIYPEPDASNAHEIIYNSKEKITSMKFDGLSFNIEQINKRERINKICFILSTLIGVFISILSEILLQKLVNRNKKTN